MSVHLTDLLAAGTPGLLADDRAGPPPACPPGVLMLPAADHRPRAQAGERLHQVFEQRCDSLCAAGQAGHIAVEGTQTVLSYAALDTLANQLARHLRQQGLRAGDVVGLLFDKGHWAIAAMLALGKIEAVYVPLDASFPADRLAFIAQDSGMRWMLSERAHEALAAASGKPLLCLDAHAKAIAAQPVQRLAPEEVGAPARRAADARCYIIYTSGSTGRPKGVPIDHAQVLNFVRVAAETYGYRADDRVYQGLTLAFDFAVEEIWVPLAVGATLVPNQTGGSLLGADLGEFLRSRRISALCCVPTLLATLEDELPALRLLIVSGEACPRDLVQRWWRPGREFLNAYGPTEATVTATLGRPQPGQPVTIGRPLPTYAILIMPPRECRALPFGEEGEIAIAGAGIASGYLNREEQTRAAFVADEIGIPHNCSGRIYRTGDLGRINAAGELEYLGRIDSQVKIRGYRIELAEIESLLLQCEGVSQAVVQPWESSPGVKELVAYYTAAPGAAPPRAEALAGALRERLPGYMVPSHYECLQQMPMLASDKADRKRLPPPRAKRLDLGQQAYVAPAEGLEQALAQVLQGLLGVERVSATAHFFQDLGMNSLLLALFSARLREAGASAGLPGTVSMRQLYGHPSVRELAAALARPAQPALAIAAVQPHRASNLAYLACGAAQLALGMAWVGANAAAAWWAVHLVIDAADWPAALVTAVCCALAYLLAAAVLPVAAKWALAGRCKPARIRAWSLDYLRFWVVKALIRSSPMVLFAGSPLYVWYLRSLGARIHPSAYVGLRTPPACPDLLQVGAEAVLCRNAELPTYRVLQGWVETGPVRVGAQARVGEFAYLDIDTALEPVAELAHASSLQAGQRVPAGALWHGSPAQPAGRAAAAPADLSMPPVPAWRRWSFCVLLLAPALTAVVLPLLGAHAVWGEGGHALDAAGEPLADLVHEGARLASAAGNEGWAGWLRWSGLAAAAYALLLLAGLLWVATVPRWCAAWLRPGRCYPLYGLHHWLQMAVRSTSNRPWFNALFGDSADIVRYLKAIGWRLPGLVQTGSNFGMAQQHDVPVLCTVGSGTLVSDGLSMLNAEIGARGLQVHEVGLGAHCFLGNAIAVPAGHRVGANCLLASKVMLPLDGPPWEGIGLLGSPAMQIPRVSALGADPTQQHSPQWRAERLRRKTRSNRIGMLLYLGLNLVPLLALAALWHELYPWGSAHGAWFAAGFANLALAFGLGWLIWVDAASRGFRALQPMRSALLEPAFWRHERHWKLGLANDNFLLAGFAGTPLRGWLWRAMGVKVGRRLLDDGASITEKTLAELGDDCTLGARAILQGHSLEDGNFQSDHLVLEDGCSVGANCYVHYGVRLGAGSTVLADAFVMKGQQVPAGEVWVGNPAQSAQGRAG